MVDISQRNGITDFNLNLSHEYKNYGHYKSKKLEGFVLFNMDIFRISDSDKTN